MGGDFEMFCGGRGANCAVAAARAGCQVKFVGGHGPDMFGKMALERLAQERIDISDFVELPSSKTGVAMVFQERKAGAHAALVALSANNQFPTTLVHRVESAIRESDVVFTQFEIAFSVLLEVFRICNRHHRRLVVHAAPVQPPIHLPNGHYHLLVADDFELRLLAGHHDLNASIQELHRRGVRNLIVKHQHRSLTFSDGTKCRVQPMPQVPFVQDAGAVECLTAWAGITLAVTDDLARATYVAAQAMGYSLSRRGAQDSVPYLSELPIDWQRAEIGSDGWG